MQHFSVGPSTKSNFFIVSLFLILLCCQLLATEKELSPKATDTEKETVLKDDKEVKETVTSVEQTEFKNSPMPTNVDENSKVLIFKLHEQFHEPLLYSFRRAIRTAKNDQSIRAFIIDMDTPGGMVAVMEEMSGLIQELEIPTYVYVSNNAISAGAILTFSTNGVYMNPRATIGAAAPVSGGGQDIEGTMEKKIMSYIRAHLRAMAQKNGFRQEVGEAMIDPSLTLSFNGKVYSTEGDLLTLTAAEAHQTVKADNLPIHAHGIVDNLEAVLEIKGLKNAEQIEVKEEAMDQIARFIKAISPFLLILAMVGIYGEMQTPGVGVMGIGGAVCFVIAFWGHHVAGLAGMEELVIIGIGILLLIAEVLILPGFGIAGIGGILCMLIGFGMMLVPHLPESIPDSGGMMNSPLVSKILQDLAFQMLYLLIGGAIAFWIFTKNFHKLPFVKGLVLAENLPVDEAVQKEHEEKETLIGLTGVCHTDLRPAGVIIIGPKRFDVTSEGGYINKGEEVVIVKATNMHIVVAPMGGYTEEEEG
ncbi:MAG: hypothetical protein MK193_11795 [Lentisphaeria bacterium]|nr:hypothetical protein [Lentisphaeria bacterium]